ncbi:hypothetical protein IWX50DRAFT_324773 [Phyllosticta citricarpa]
MQRGDKERLGCWDRDRRGHYRTRDEGIKKLPVKQPACRHDGIWRERGKEQPWGTQEQTVSSEPYRSPNVPHAAIKHSKSCLECAAVQCWSTIALGGRLVTPGVPSPRPPTPRVQLQRVLYKTTHCHRNAARSSRPRCGPHGNTCGRVHMLVFPVFFFLSIFFFFFPSSTTGHARLGSRGCLHANRCVALSDPRDSTRLLLSPCVPFTPLCFAPQLTWVHTLLHRSSPESLGLQSLPCLSPWPGIRSVTARAEGTLLLVSPYLFLDASKSSRHCSRRQASNRNLQSTQKPSEGGLPT